MSASGQYSHNISDVQDKAGIFKIGLLTAMRHDSNRF